MTLDALSCYRALRARDRRFDGAFFVGVSTTGIYCRPICTARVPGFDRCTFFARAAEAERAGYRACFLCRPELAPGLAPIDAMPRLVRRAVAAIDGGCLDERSVEALAAELCVTARHLRRAMEAELGVSPVEYAQTQRLALAKRLLHDTSMSLTGVAFASGFGSVRRFNALFKKTFARAPSELRRSHVGLRPLERCAIDGADGAAMIPLRLDYRPPMSWPELLDFLRSRAIRGVEAVSSDSYRRTVRIGDDVGWLEVRHASGTLPALVAHLSFSLASKLPAIVSRLRTLFDLDAQPEMVAEHLRSDAPLRRLVTRRPGLRLPGAFDPFEMAVRAVLGQQISVKGASTLCARLVAAFGSPSPLPELPSLFPTAAELAEVDAAALAKIGLPLARARTIVALAAAVASRRIDLSGSAAPEATIAELETLPGIGPWTAHYLAMRAMHWPDAFPAGDLGVKKALGMASAREVEARAAAWRPWRAYAVMHLWGSLSEGGLS